MSSSKIICTVVRAGARAGAPPLRARVQPPATTTTPAMLLSRLYSSKFPFEGTSMPASLAAYYKNEAKPFERAAAMDAFEGKQRGQPAASSPAPKPPLTSSASAYYGIKKATASSSATEGSESGQTAEKSSESLPLADMESPNFAASLGYRVEPVEIKPPPPQIQPLPPLLVRIKGDLKTAMRERDTNRLVVLRGVIAACINAEKTPIKIRTDALLVRMLRRMIRISEDAAAEAVKEGRDDIATKEKAQQEILQNYVDTSGIKEMSSEELRTLVEQAVAKIRSLYGSNGMRTKEGGKSIFGAAMKMIKTNAMAGSNIDGVALSQMVKSVIRGSAPTNKKEE